MYLPKQGSFKGHFFYIRRDSYGSEFRYGFQKGC